MLFDLKFNETKLCNYLHENINWNCPLTQAFLCFINFFSRFHTDFSIKMDYKN